LEWAQRRSFGQKWGPYPALFGSWRLLLFTNFGDDDTLNGDLDVSVHRWDGPQVGNPFRTVQSLMIKDLKVFALLMRSQRRKGRFTSFIIDRRVGGLWILKNVYGWLLRVIFESFPNSLSASWMGVENARCQRLWGWSGLSKGEPNHGGHHCDWSWSKRCQMLLWLIIENAERFGYHSYISLEEEVGEALSKATAADEQVLNCSKDSRVRLDYDGAKPMTALRFADVDLKIAGPGDWWNPTKWNYRFIDCWLELKDARFWP